MIMYNSHPKFRATHKKYTVGGGNFYAKTDTLAEAKTAGMSIAKRELGRGKWNRMFIVVDIQVQKFPESIFYKSTGWQIYVPVRGTGTNYDKIGEYACNKILGSFQDWSQVV